MAKKRKATDIRKLDCVWSYVEESERKGKYEYVEEVNQQMRKKRKTKRKNKGFGFGKLKQRGRKYMDYLQKLLHNFFFTTLM